jgi:hypothetical protein
MAFIAAAPRFISASVMVGGGGTATGGGDLAYWA